MHVTRKSKNIHKPKNYKKSKNSSKKEQAGLTTLLDFKKTKSLTILSKPSDIKSITSVGDF